MLLAYLDESHDKVEYWMAALIVPCESALQLQNDLDAVVNNAMMSGYGVPHARGVECHCHLWSTCPRWDRHPHSSVHSRLLAVVFRG